MSNSFRSSAKLEGAEELDRMLKELPTKVQNKIGRQAMRAGAKIVAGKTKSLAPVGQSSRQHPAGQLKRAIKVRAGKKKKGRISMLVQIGKGFFKGSTFYAGFVAYGHRAGKRLTNVSFGIRRRMRNGLKQKLIKARKGDNRKQVTANQFMEAGFTLSKGEAVKAITQELSSGIEKAAKL